MIQRQRKTPQDTKEYTKKMNGMVPPTYDKGQRSMSVQHINNLDYSHENNNQNNIPIVNNINLNLNKKNSQLSVETNVNNNNNNNCNQTTHLIPSISVSSDMSSVSYTNENHMNEKFHNGHSMLTKIKQFFRPNSKSPTPESAEARSQFYLPNHGNNARNGNRTLSGGGSSSLSKATGSSFLHSHSMQEKKAKNSNESLTSLNNDLVNGYTAYNNAASNSPRSLHPTVTMVNNLPKRAEKFFYDKETKDEIKRIFGLLPLEEQIVLQEKGRMLMEKQLDINKVILDSIKLDIQEKINELKEQNDPYKSAFEIEQLRGEIRALTNEKAELEIKIGSKADWACKKCTLHNSSNLIKCAICNTERDVTDEIILCPQCNAKNPLTTYNCINCKAYFYSTFDLNNNNNRQMTNTSRTSSSSSTSLSSPIMPSLLQSSFSPHSIHLQGQQKTYQNIERVNLPLSPRIYNNNSNSFQLNQ